MRKFLVAFAIIGGIVLVIWGGYSLYNRNTGGQSSGDLPFIPPETAQTVRDDSSAPISTPDTSRTPEPPSNLRSYKFIIERTASKRRALYRYNQLLSHKADIRMETPDSLNFTLYFLIAAPPADTARIKDSLRVWYDRRQVYIEPG